MTLRTPTAAAVALTIAVTLAGCADNPTPFQEGVERVHVVDATGATVGTVPVDAIEDVAQNGGRTPVHNDDGEQVGWWTADGFEDL